MSSGKSTGCILSSKTYTKGIPFGILKCWTSSLGIASITLTSDRIVLAWATTRTLFPDLTVRLITYRIQSREAVMLKRCSRETIRRTEFQYPNARISHVLNDSADGQWFIEGSSKCFKISSWKTPDGLYCCWLYFSLSWSVNWLTFLLNAGSFIEGGVSVYDRRHRNICSSPNSLVKYSQSLVWPWSNP